MGIISSENIRYGHQTLDNMKSACAGRGSRHYSVNIHLIIIKCYWRALNASNSKACETRPRMGSKQGLSGRTFSDHERPPAPADLQILVVDNGAQSRQTVAALLRDLSYQVRKPSPATLTFVDQSGTRITIFYNAAQSYITTGHFRGHVRRGTALARQAWTGTAAVLRPHP